MIDLNKIALDKVLEPDLYALNALDENGLRSRLRVYISEFNKISMRISASQKQYDFLFFRSLVRDDYKSFFKEVYEVAPGEAVVVEDYEDKGLNTKATNLVFKYSKELNRRLSAFPPLIRKCLIFRMLKYISIVEDLAYIQYRVLVVFGDMQPVENLLVQVAKLNGIKTVTLQHGLYVDYSAMDNVNVVNYKNHVSDYFFGWGINTEILLRKYIQNLNFIHCGKPSIYGLKAFDSYSVKKSLGKLDFLLITDQRIFKSYNYSLADIICQVASDLGREVYVRFHPSNDKNEFKRMFPAVREVVDITNPYIVIGHTSSLIYEAHTLGYPASRFATEVPAIKLSEDSEFSNAEEFKRVLANIERGAGVKTNSVSNDFYSYIGASSLEKYRTSFTEVLNLASSYERP